MLVLAAVLGGVLIIVVLWDAFETVVLPRRVARRVRLTRIFYRATWRPWAALADWLPRSRRRETYLSFYGPLSLLFLMWVWAAGLILGFALLDWGSGSGINAQRQTISFTENLYLSGTTFFTLGLGDVIPRTPLARALTVVESGMGFGFLALVIGYLPVLYQSFSRREVNITLLDARAGSPPSAAELLRRHSTANGFQALQEFLHDSERWAAELLESHISYPQLAYFRSQHANQSWLGALTTILDASALVIVGVKGACAHQAQLTFAIARHAVVDLAQIFGTPPQVLATNRLPAADWSVLCARLAADGLAFREGGDTEARLLELRQMYEPYVNVLANYLRMSVPPWMPAAHSKDNWQTSAWRQPAAAPAPHSAGAAADHHF